MSKPAKVAWGMVAYGPFPYAPVYTSHLRAIAYASRYFATEIVDGSKIAGVGSTDRMYTHSAGNAVVRDFLAIEDATHLLMVEMDMIIPDDTIPKLLAVDKDIVSGLYFLRHGRGQPCLYKRVIEVGPNPYVQSPVSLFPTTEPFKLDGCCGLGCVLIKREVFERIEQPWFDLKERDPKTGAGHGSDMYFYTKARQAGCEIWIEPTVRCDQIDYVLVGFNDYVERVRTDPEFGRSGVIIGAPDLNGAAR